MLIFNAPPRALRSSSFDSEDCAIDSGKSRDDDHHRAAVRTLLEIRARLAALPSPALTGVHPGDSRLKAY
jgi:hypothetical protein